MIWWWQKYTENTLFSYVGGRFSLHEHNRHNLKLWAYFICHHVRQIHLSLSFSLSHLSFSPKRHFVLDDNLSYLYLRVKKRENPEKEKERKRKKVPSTIWRYRPPNQIHLKIFVFYLFFTWLYLGGILGERKREKLWLLTTTITNTSSQLCSLPPKKKKKTTIVV